MAKKPADESESDPPTYVRLTDDERRKLKAIASKEERPLSHIIRRAVQIYLAGGVEQYVRAVAERAEQHIGPTPAELKVIQGFGQLNDEEVDVLLDLGTEIRSRRLRTDAVAAIVRAFQSDRGASPPGRGRARS